MIAAQVQRKTMYVARIPFIDLGKIHRAFSMDNTVQAREGYRKYWFLAQEGNWWRRRESNPRPKMLLVKRLHAYSRSCPRHYPGTFAASAQNGQETDAASLRS